MTVTTTRGPVEVRGTLLAQTSSRQFSHRHPSSHAQPGQRCSACRWTRITILRDEDPAVERHYVVVSEGFSLVPGERVIGQVERTSSPVWVIECLHRKNKEHEKYLSIVARNALLMAAEMDEKLATECVHRGIS